MKKIFVYIMLVFSLIFLSACSGRKENEENNISMSIEQMQESEELLEESQNYDSEDNGLDSDENSAEQQPSGSKSTMKKCSGGTDPHYLIYIEEDSAYQRVDTGNGGSSEVAVTRYQSCAVANPSEVGRKCVVLSPAEYYDNYGTIKAVTEEPVASMMGLVCTIEEYDAEVFELD